MMKTRSVYNWGGPGVLVTNINPFLDRDYIALQIPAWSKTLDDQIESDLLTAFRLYMTPSIVRMHARMRSE